MTGESSLLDQSNDWPDSDVDLVLNPTARFDSPFFLESSPIHFEIERCAISYRIERDEKLETATNARHHQKLTFCMPDDYPGHSSISTLHQVEGWENLSH